MGQLTITDHDGRAVAPEGLPPRARQVLGVLAAQHDRLLSKDGLADAIWGDRPPDKFVAALEHYVSVLRRRLEPGRPRAESFIVTRAGGYLFATDRAALDLAEVRELVAHGDAWPAGTPERVALRQRLIDAATALPFAEDEYATWAAGPRAEVRAAMITAHVEVGSAVEPVDPEQALRLARRAIDLDRYAERPYQIAMRASAALGRQDEALRWYEQCSRSLRAELGVDPADETRRLRDRIAADRVTALPVRTGTPHQTLHAGDGAPARDHPATAAHPRRRAGQVGADATLVPAIGPDQLAPDRGRWGRARRDARRAPDGVLRRLPLRLMDTGPGADADQPPGGSGAAPATGPGGPTGPGAGPPDFVGRRAEIEMLLGAPPVPLVHLVGPAGAGKSALLAELGRRAPGRVAVGSALGAAELRLSWLHSALAQLGIRGPAALAVDQAMAAGRSLTPAELNGLAEAITERGPVLLGVDDAAALDERSVAELGFLVRHGRGAVCLTVALRCDAHLRDLPVAGLHDAVVLHLRRLTPAEVRGGADQDAAEGCGGIPALLAALHRPRPVAMATAVHLVGLRTRGLPAAAARILRTCATLGPLRIDQVAGLIELPVAEVLRCTDELLHAELLDEVPGGRIRHSSELVRAALAEQVSGAHTNYLRQRLKGSCA